LISQPAAVNEAAMARGQQDRRALDDGAPLGQVLEFMRLLWWIDHGLQTTSKRMEATLGITGLQRMVLRLVGRFPAISAGRLARLLHVHPSTLTGVLKRLEEKGLVNRGVDPLDARRALFTLTGRGRALDVPETGTVEVAVRRALERVSGAKIATAREVLRALAQELGDGAATTSAPRRAARHATRRGRR
jgi:MarR family transcriptional regulator, organic hydroperoxide resistance regulator